MKIHYLFSSPEGDLPIDTTILQQPFRVTPYETHPDMTLADYFEAIENFILSEKGRWLLQAIDDVINRSTRMEDIDTIVVRSEKHGALYHIASVETFTEDQKVKFTVSAAISEPAKEWLSHEFDILNFLNQRFNFPYLPRVYFKKRVQHRSETILMSLSEWFQGYHEWHLTMDGMDRQQIVIWDVEHGNRFASKEEVYGIYRDSSKILTLYYDIMDFRQIYPWHHAAGDFVVMGGKESIKVKLTTARRYESIMVFLGENNINPLVAIIYFFLNLSLKMRLDRLDGIGAMAWAEEPVLRAVMDGFFEGLKAKEGEGTSWIVRAEELLNILKSFNKAELEVMLISLLELYSKGYSEDFSVVEQHLSEHAKELYTAIQDFRFPHKFNGNNLGL